MSLRLMFRVISPPPLTSGIQFEVSPLEARWFWAFGLRFIHAIEYELAQRAIMGRIVAD